MKSSKGGYYIGFVQGLKDILQSNNAADYYQRPTHDKGECKSCIHTEKLREELDTPVIFEKGRFCAKVIKEILKENTLKEGDMGELKQKGGCIATRW